MEQGAPSCPSDFFSSATMTQPVVNGSMMKSDSILDALRVSDSSLLLPDPPSGAGAGVGGSSGVVCRKSQTVIASSPVNVFLALMNTTEGGCVWPQERGSSLKVM